MNSEHAAQIFFIHYLVTSAGFERGAVYPNTPSDPPANRVPVTQTRTGDSLTITGLHWRLAAGAQVGTGDHSRLALITPSDTPAILVPVTQARTGEHMRALATRCRAHKITGDSMPSSEDDW